MNIMNTPFFRTTGIYIGFIFNGFVFSRDGEYLGWQEGQNIWGKDGQFKGSVYELNGAHYILKNRFQISPIPRMPKLPPLPPTPPIPQLNKLPILVGIGLEDAF